MIAEMASTVLAGEEGGQAPTSAEPLFPKHCRFSLLVETTEDFMPITITNLSGATVEGGRVEEEQEDRLHILRYVEDNVVGRETYFPGPFGEKQVVYCDYTASGRPLKFIEDYITNHVHPLYANTHTTTGLMARQTTQFRREAREIIKRCVNASEKDVVIFTGSGTTGAVHKLLTALELKGDRAKKTVVFVGPYEHHSNILPWKETGAKVVRIRDADRGQIDMKLLEEKLKYYQHKSRLMIGCFSAASNVTGIVSDTLAVAALLHRYGALSFWDYATAGPYLNIDMNPVVAMEDEHYQEQMESLDFSKDAVYLSPHKFVGGVGTPGLLIAKKKLFMNAVPGSVGGGTVLYVTRDTHRYVSNIEEREEGGTPAIVESIRAGLVFRLKEAITPALIEEQEHDLSLLAFKTWRRNPNLLFLGSKRAERLPIFSFLIVHPPSGKVLHHNYVAALLNDMYGIQARGGCACAGPYAQDLLGINEPMAVQFADFLVDNTGDEMPSTKGKKNGKVHRHKRLEIMKPGFTRLNMPFFFSDDVTNFVLQAINDVATNGWKMLPQYEFDMSSNWVYRNQNSDGQDETKMETLGDSLLTTSFVHGEFKAPPSPFVSRKKYVQTTKFQDTLQIANVFYSEAETKCKEMPDLVQDDEFIEAVGNPSLVWFLQPHEAQAHLRDPSLDQTDVGNESGAALRLKVKNVPFKPRQSTARRSLFSRRSRSRHLHKHQAKETGKKTMKMCTLL